MFFEFSTKRWKSQKGHIPGKNVEQKTPKGKEGGLLTCMYSHNGLEICKMAVQSCELSFGDIMMPFDSRAQSFCSTVVILLVNVRHCRNPASPRKVPECC